MPTIRENIELIAKSFDAALEQLTEFLEHPSVVPSRESILEFMNLKMKANMEYLAMVFKKPWEILVFIDNDGSINVDISSPELGFLRASGEVKGGSFKDVLLDYYRWHLSGLAAKMKAQETNDKSSNKPKPANRLKRTSGNLAKRSRIGSKKH